MSVNPAVHPPTVLDTMESGPPHYERYFMHKWRRSLDRKRQIWPDRYDGGWMEVEGLRETTRWLISTFGEFPDLESYFEGYSIAGEYLASLDVPATIITAADDPIIPVADFEDLRLPPCASLDIQRWGGHCGFLENLAGRSWIRRRVCSIIENVVDQTSSIAISAGPDSRRNDPLDAARGTT